MVHTFGRLRPGHCFVLHATFTMIAAGGCAGGSGPDRSDATPEVDVGTADDSRNGAAARDPDRSIPVRPGDGGVDALIGRDAEMAGNHRDGVARRDRVADGGPADASMPPDHSEDGGPADEEADGGQADSAADGGGGLGCLSAAGADPSGTSTWIDDLGQATVSIDVPEACRRTYRLSTTQPLRGEGLDSPRTIVEHPDDSTLRTGHSLVDALYALAVQEARESVVDAVEDQDFNHGEPLSCGEEGCFAKSHLWGHIWTRDAAFAADLGLAALDPIRARNTLEHQLSERRAGGDLQIVQEPGTGGGYPVSTDRVAWALGALALHAQLEGEARADFVARAYLALRNTLEHDRAVVFDPVDGLYRGEQAFLDLREQTYPEWAGSDVVHIGMSKALSTNLLHLRAMEITAALADEIGDLDGRDRFSGYAEDLRAAIGERFWVEEDGLFSTYLTTALDAAPARRYDLLGSALAVLFGVADTAQAAAVLARYPHYGPGAPVIWPQQQLTPIYQNRGEWPFVTAYWLRAAKVVDNDAVADRMVRALVRGAALNLSNMQCFEAATGAPWVDDRDSSGPIVSSSRYLASVAGFLSMVHHTLFGLEPEPDALRVRPYLTRGLRNTLFAGTDRLVLNDYRYRGRRLSVVLHLPPAGGQGGSYAVGEMRVDGTPLGQNEVVPAQLEGHSRLDIDLVDAGDRQPAALEHRDPEDEEAVYGPRTPLIGGLGETSGKIGISLSSGGQAAEQVNFFVYRDGEVVATDLPGGMTFFVDADSDAFAPQSPCYVVESCFVSSGNCSQRSLPVCWWGSSWEAILEFWAPQLEGPGDAPEHLHGRPAWWVAIDQGEELVLPELTAERTGTHLIQLEYTNGAAAVASGMTCGVARVLVTDVTSDSVAGEGVAVLPHTGGWEQWRGSSFVRAVLEAGRTYRVDVRGDDRAINMSSFARFETYTAGPGGADGAFNQVLVGGLRVLAR